MNKSTIEKLVYSSQDESIEFLKTLVGFDSQMINQGVGGMEKEIQRNLSGFFDALGGQVDVFVPENKRLSRYSDYNSGHDYTNRPNVVAVLKGAGGGRSIILNGHVDTVHPGNLAEWNSDPFIPCIKDGYIYGLGVADMKGGLAAMLMATSILKRNGIEIKGDIIFECVVDEEGGGNGSLACVDRGYSADAALIAEPTDMQICCSHRGAMHMALTTRGRATHASMRNSGINAISKMRILLDALEKLDDAWSRSKTHKYLPAGAITCCYIEGGTGASIIPDLCKAKINIKYLPYEKSIDVRREVENCIITSAQKDSWLLSNAPEISWLSNAEPYETSDNHPIVDTMRKACEDSGIEVRIAGLPSGTDARILNNIGKVPSFIFGPGSLSDVHKPNEKLKLTEYLKAIEVYTRILCNWCC